MGDSSGAANPGTLGPVSKTTWGTGVNNTSAISLVGDSTGDSYVSAAGPAVATNISFSVSAWVYLTNTTISRVALSQSGSIASGFMLRYNHYNSKWEFALSQSESYAPTYDSSYSGTNAVPNTWVHLVGVYDSAAGAGQQVKLYVDGAAQAAAGHTSVWNATSGFQIGRVREFGAWQTGSVGDEAWGPWAGRIDEVRVYNRALTSTEIANLAADPPKVRWDFNEGAGASTADLAGGDNAGSLLGAGTGTSTFTSVANGHSGAAVNMSYSTAANYGYVQGAAPGIRTDESYSVAAWVYLSGASARARTVASQNGSTHAGFILKHDSVGTWAFMAMTNSSGGADQVNSGVAAAVDTWVHLVAVHDDANDLIRLHVGTAVGNAMGSPWSAAHSVEYNATGAFTLGRAQWGGATTFVDAMGGRVDSVRAYQRALTATEVAALRAETEPAPLFTEANMTAGLVGALQGAEQGQKSTTAVAFAGTQHGYTNTSQGNPTSFTIECWFKVSGDRGGTLIALQSDKTSATSGTTDRALYVDSGGKISFVVRNGSNIQLRSTNSYNDGNWHHVAASLGPNPSADSGGMRLYVDGALVTWGTNTGAYNHTTAYWRWGGAYLVHGTAFPDRPASDYLVGALDEVVIYSSQLTDEQIAWHYYANH